MSKAKAEISIYHIIDISKVTRYYKLQSSTASVPGVPTTNPPSGWTATEPAYTSGSTNTLYFVDLTEFTNGTFKYSAVSKSSSYEAAKAAYNKAVSTEQFVTNHMELTDNGLVVGNLTGETLQGNVLIDTDSVDVRVGEKVVASYQGKNIYLGKDSAESVIDLCDGTGTIENRSFRGDEWRTLNIRSNGSIRLDSMDENALYSNTSIFNDDGSESMYSSSMFLTAYPRWVEDADLVNDNRGISIHDHFSKIAYNNGSSSIAAESQASIDLIANERESIVDITSRVEYEDYSDSPHLTVIGKREGEVGGAYEGEVYSYASINADKIHLMTNELLVSDRNHSVDSKSGIKRVLLSSVNGNDYWGMVTPEGSESGWIRTTTSGIIPHAQDSTDGVSSLGTSSWPFKAIYGRNIYTRKVNDTIGMDTDGDIIVPIGKGYHSYLSNGATTRSLIYMNSNQNTVVGYGGYSNNDGDTSVYGKAVGITSKGAINITSPTAGLSGRAYGVNNSLWSGAHYMNENQTVTLTEAVKAQPHGIILMWSLYSGGAASNSDFNYTFIPKKHVISAAAKGVSCFLTSASMGNVTTKYVYVDNTTIKGHVNNTGTESTDSGIEKNASAFVLRQVIGV